MPSDHQRAWTVAVARTGGLAGLTRTWSVTAPVERADEWDALVEECPWDRGGAASVGADRFCWTVTADRGDEWRRATLAEDQVAGPWRTLIDAVRSAEDPETASPTEQ